MDPARLISRRFSFQGNLAVASVTVSFLVMIVAVAISSGFRHAIREGVGRLAGDITLAPISGEEGAVVPADLPSKDKILAISDVSALTPVLIRSGIVQSGDLIHGVVVKGVPETAEPVLDSALTVSIPSRLAEITGLGVGDQMTTYFIDENVRVRRFRIAAIHEDIVQLDDHLVVRARLSDMQRLCGVGEDLCSAVEVSVKEHGREAVNQATAEIGEILLMSDSEAEQALYAASSVRAWPAIFDWLDLLDFNVVVVLVLMTIVAGFNMISGLLILLLRNTSAIGTLKTLGMTDRAISRVFAQVASRVVFKGMLLGNALALLFVLIQGTTHLIKLDPANYFVSWVPVSLNLPRILFCDVAAYLVILALTALPSLFIARVDPAKTVKAE